MLEEDGHILKINDDHPTLEALVREERMNELMVQLIEDFKKEIHVENRLDEEQFLWDPREAGSDTASGPDGARG